MDFVLEEPTLFWFGKKIQIHYDKDVELFSKDLINVTLKIGQSIRELKKHNLIFKMAVSSTKSSFLSVTLSNSNLVVSTSQVQLGEVFGLT